MNLIVFSKDRPMQLRATLESVKVNIPFADPITVIYKPSETFKGGYEKLKVEFSDVVWVEEGNFKGDVLSALQGECTLFLTDDDIVFGEVKEDCLLGDEELLDNVIFSLRLGGNIDYCYSNNKTNEPQQKFGEADGIINWWWRKELLDWGYPLSVTAHIFKTRFIKDLTRGCSFKNPNEYEGQLQRFLDKCPNLMFAYTSSRVVGVPANRVNTVCQNRNGLKHGYTVEELQKLFDEGKRIAWEKMDFSNINAAQQELPYVFE